MDWMRVGAAALLTGACTLLVACGSGVVSDLDPERFITVGDGFLDVGQNGGKIFTVDNGEPTWVQQIAANYGLGLEAESSGGLGYAEGEACVGIASGSCATAARSIREQTDALLSRGIEENDLVLVGGGIQDIVAAVEAAVAAGKTGKEVRDWAKPQVEEAARLLSDQAVRIFRAGASHVLVAGVYNLGNTPWAKDLRTEVEDLSVDFNSELAMRLNESIRGDIHVLFVDPALFSNLIYNEPGDYGFDENKNDKWACHQLIPVERCTPTTAEPDYNKYIFADNLYMTPRMLNYYADKDYIESVYGMMDYHW
ncbi:MAG: hypothetical protein WCZ18_02165 [Ottowia sp.]|nr:SGNH/GDSL hydrolase family protein [Ottowia sp.]